MSRVMYPRPCAHRESMGRLLRLRLSHSRSNTRQITCSTRLRSGNAGPSFLSGTRLRCVLPGG
jgi:hypothetical protein